MSGFCCVLAFGLCT